MKKLNKLILLITTICSLNCSAQTTPTYVPTSNLLAWYSFNSNANDLSGNGNNGTVNGATLSADRFGIPNSAYAFNGSNSYIDLAASIFNNPQIYSISCWSRFNSNSFSFLFGQATNGEIQLQSDGSGNVVSWNKLNSGGSVSVGTTITDLTNWHHLVSIFNNVTKTLTIYIDNIGYSTTIPPGVNIAPSTGRALLGRQSNLAANFFNGNLDDIGFWNKELTPCEINQLYNASILPVLSVSASNSVICVGNSAILTVSTTASTYTWNTGATTMTVSVSPTVTSTYTVSASNSVACLNTSTVMVTVNACAGINEIRGQSTSIFPNPNNGLFTIELKETTEVIITDILGQILLKSNLNAGNQILDIKNNADGIYFVQLIKDGKQQTIKLVKE